MSSSGLHTNGYSLARKLFFDVAKLTVDSWHGELNRTVGETLLEPHLNYTRPIRRLLDNQLDIKGMAHITGGGFLENIPRVLPVGCSVDIDSASWLVPPVFRIMQALGSLNQQEMFRTFNMGIGFIVIVGEDTVDAVQHHLSSFSEFSVHELGRVVPSEQKVVRIL